MKIFLDSKARSWEVELTLGQARRIKQRLDWNILDPASEIDGQPLTQKLLLDDVALGSVLAVLVQEQLKERGLSVEDLENALDGDALKAFENAFWEEYQTFFTDRGRAWIAEAIKADLAAVQEAGKKALATLSNGKTSTDSQEEQEPAPTSND